MEKLKKTYRRLLLIAFSTLLWTAAVVTPVCAKEKWPKMPKVEAPSICVIEISTGTLLYGRNMDEINYPASITKIMTALLAVENCALDETVTFSEEAVYGNEGDTSHISRDVGEKMTMEECLYGMMLESANECAWAIGEHVGGTMEAFTKMMNARAKELGCENTHFNNPNGLPDEDHWTTAHDMALISAEAYKNETFRVIAGAKAYTIPPTNKHSEQTLLHNHHKMIYPYRGDYGHLYDYAAGGKTGYTNAAGNTLVSYAQKGDMAFVCVVMKEKSPDHYTDTRTMFDYCFDNFKLLQVADYETDQKTERDVPAFASVDEEAMVLLPASVDFSALKAEITYDNTDEDVLGTFVYTYADHIVGQADIRMNEIAAEGYPFTHNESGKHVETDAAQQTDGGSNAAIPNEERTENVENNAAKTDSAAEPSDKVTASDANAEIDKTDAEESETAKKETDKKETLVERVIHKLTDTVQQAKEKNSIHIELSLKNIALALGIIIGMLALLLGLYWIVTHWYLIRQKMVSRKIRRMEKNRYRTISETNNGRRRGRRRRKNKNLRF